MMADKPRTIMAIGGHIGDMELTAGGVLATNSLNGGKIITVALTAGERGNPPHLTVAEYRQQKIQEARGFAEMLGGEAVVLDYADGELPVDETVKFQLCDLIRQYKPDVLITHWKNSMHKDHMAAHQIVKDAQFYASLPSFERALPAHYAAGPYYAENWEDDIDFKPYLYVEVSAEGFALWQNAIALHWFVTGSKSFKYKEYYEHLMALRGMLARKAYAQAFDVEPMVKKVVRTSL